MIGIYQFSLNIISFVLIVEKLTIERIVIAGIATTSLTEGYKMANLLKKGWLKIKNSRFYVKTLVVLRFVAFSQYILSFLVVIGLFIVNEPLNKQFYILLIDNLLQLIISSFLIKYLSEDIKKLQSS